MSQIQQQLTTSRNWLSLRESWQSRQALTERASPLTIH